MKVPYAPVLGKRLSSSDAEDELDVVVSGSDVTVVLECSLELLPIAHAVEDDVLSEESKSDGDELDACVSDSDFAVVLRGSLELLPVAHAIEIGLAVFPNSEVESVGCSALKL